jgi:hypothetical protein
LVETSLLGRAVEKGGSSKKGGGSGTTWKSIRTTQVAELLRSGTIVVTLEKCGNVFNSRLLLEPKSLSTIEPYLIVI